MDSDNAMIPKELRKAVDKAVPSGITHLGVVVTNVFGEYLVTEPKGHPYGVSATFNKIKLQPSERPAEALERCLREQVGVALEGVFPIPVAWTTSNSTAFYFAGMTWNEGEPPANSAGKAAWCDRGEAERRIGLSQNHESKQRDLGLLGAASQMCLSPFRRVLLMVHELHMMGFERLRAPAYQYPVAWRCPIVPAYWTLRSHGGMFEDPSSQIEHWFGVKTCQYGYSSACGQFPFELANTAFDTPHDLARRFVQERREIACAGWGPDATYARWFEDVLEATQPNGLYYAFAEFQEPTDYLYTHMTRVERVPLPPPGWATKDEFANHGADALGNGDVFHERDET